MSAGSGTAVAPEGSGQSQGTGISPWACYQCRKRKVKCDKTTPSCEICLRNKQSCRYPLTAQKPGPKLGSIQKRKAKPSRRRHSRTSISAPESPRIRSGRSVGEYPDAKDVPLYGLAAHKAKPSSLSSWILHHFHEKQAYDVGMEESRESFPPPEVLPTIPKAIGQNIAAHVCAALEIHQDELSQLLALFFSDLPSISLFHQPTFQHRIYNEFSAEQSTALLASIISLSARHLQNDQSNVRNGVLSPSKFYKIASDLVHTQLQNCGDKPPPLVLLQTSILTTYYELVSGVRGIAWRSLGAAIRIAYELRLHLIDLPLKLSPTSTDSDSVDVWIAKEERRRAWWTLWELEVFAGFIRKCPLAMDIRQHATLLPSDDTRWFKGEKSPSCFLEPDPVLRWKTLKRSDNEGGRAWFIVINSLLNDAHFLTNASVPVDNFGEEDSTSYAPHHSTSKQMADQASKLAVLDNCISCFEMSLPQQFRFRPEHLRSSSFRQNKTDTHKKESEKQSIHAMIHLAKIMILHKNCFRRNDQDGESNGGISVFSNAETCPLQDEFSSHSNSAWSRYLLAAENVVGIVRNSSIDHIRYRHPLLVNTFWIIAAIQLVQGTIAKTDSEKILAKSNFELLCLTLTQHEQYWGTSPVLVHNLKKLRRSLDNTRGCTVSESALTVQSSTARYSTAHWDYHQENDWPPIFTAWEDIEQNNTVNCMRQPSIVTNEGDFNFYSACNVDDKYPDSLQLDLSLHNLVSEIWHSSHLDNPYDGDNILQP